MNSTLKLTPTSVGLAILVGTLIGPLSQMAKGVTTSDIANTLYWADLLAATLTALATSVVGVLTLIAGAIGIPAIMEKDKSA